MKNKTGLVFKGESDRLPNHKPGNVIITLDLQDSSEQMYKRSGDSLLLTVDINLTQNYKLSGQIKTLDGRILSLTCDDKSIVNKNNGIRKIVGEGMPIENTDKKGDLYVRFRVTLPPELSDEKLENLKKVFEVPKIVESSIPTKVLQLQDSDLTGLDEYESDSDDYYDSDESSNSDDSEESYDDEGKKIEEIVEEMINEK
jgi:DnaJ-class molecular chaperone